MLDLILLDFHFTDLLQPQWYIQNGGLWFVLFVVFAETGLFAGFFLPGDSLLFVTGIYSNDMIKQGLKFDTGSDFLNMMIVVLLVTLAGIIGNYVGYWFGRKSGPALYNRKDTFLFKQKYLQQARDFYEKNGGFTIVVARFVPFVRTFAPIVAGIVQMDYKRFTFYNVIGCVAWSFSMIAAGHYLQKLFMSQFNFDLTKHLEIIVLGIVLVSTLPIIFKLLKNRREEKQKKAS
ncbi:MAG: VTT domain-containing protein [Flavihumibacter sp.]|nr:VTT domain-containing protein [Flavihumibacter sp.]